MKTALVTGATKGIGLAVAKMLLSKGYYVIATFSHDEVAANNARLNFQQISENFEIIKSSHAVTLQRQVIVERITQLGHIDCLICNAGTTLRKSLPDITDEDWNDVMNINVNSNVFLIRDLFSFFTHNARIVFIGSLMGIYPHGTSLAYGVSKTAVHALAPNLVKCFEGTNVTVNAIAPGFVDTEWQKNKDPQIRQNICNKTALGRFATVEEIANAVEFCVENSFVNGSVIEVSGGYCYK